MAGKGRYNQQFIGMYLITGAVDLNGQYPAVYGDNLAVDDTAVVTPAVIGKKDTDAFKMHRLIDICFHIKHTHSLPYHLHIRINTCYPTMKQQYARKQQQTHQWK